jgi:hypothetical protein
MVKGGTFTQLNAIFAVLFLKFTVKDRTPVFRDSKSVR